MNNAFYDASVARFGGAGFGKRDIEIRTSENKLIEEVLRPYEEAFATQFVEPSEWPPNPQYVLATGGTAVHRLKILDQVYGSGTREVLQHSGLQRGMRVADIGCGVGMVTRLLADLVGPEGTAIGVDVSADQLEQ